MWYRLSLSDKLRSGRLVHFVMTGWLLLLGSVGVQIKMGVAPADTRAASLSLTVTEKQEYNK